jgi:hypothetical protein
MYLGNDWNRSMECNAAVQRSASPALLLLLLLLQLLSTLVSPLLVIADRNFGIVLRGISSFVKYDDKPDGIPPSIFAIVSTSFARDEGSRQAPANGGPP